jgi:hypothetical protein
MNKLKWWGYLHVNGNIQAKRYFSRLDIQEARESEFVRYIYGPFDAMNRDEALDILYERFGSSFT